MIISIRISAATSVRKPPIRNNGVYPLSEIATPPRIGENAAAMPDIVEYFPNAVPRFFVSTDSATSVFATRKNELPSPEIGSAMAESRKLCENANTKMAKAEIMLENTMTFFLPYASAKAPAGDDPKATIASQAA